MALYDVKKEAAEAAKVHIAANLEEQATFGLVQDPKGSAARLSVAADLASALKGAVLAQESGPEDLDAKKALFAEMDALAGPETILASSTSFIMASRFTEGLKGRGRCLVAHPRTRHISSPSWSCRRRRGRTRPS